MADLFEEFLLKIASSQLKRLSLTENEGSVVTGCKIMRRARFWSFKSIFRYYFSLCLTSLVSHGYLQWWRGIVVASLV